MGFHSPFSSTYKVLLSKNRMVHNINVTFDDSNCTEQRALPSAPPQPSQLLDVRIEQAPSAATEEDCGMDGLQHHSPHSRLQSPSQHSTSQFPWPSPGPSISPLGSPVGSHSHHSSQSTQFSWPPSPFADSQFEGGNATLQCHGNPAWQPPQLDLDNDGVEQYFNLNNPEQ